MATAVGTYATLAGVKARKGITDSTSDTLIQSLCDQVNSWLEDKLGRPIAPWPTLSTTVASGFAVGTNTGVVASATGIALGDALMFGPVSGTHEHGIVQGISGTTITLQANLANSYAGSTAIKRVYVFDGYNAYDLGRTLSISDGITSVLSLEVAVVTNGPFSQIQGTDFFLRPVPAKRNGYGWPAERITMTDYPGGGSPVSPLFYMGFGNIRIDGQMGWAAIPDNLTGLGQKLAVAAFATRGSGGGNQVTVGIDGERTFEQAMSTQDWQTIKLYTNEITAF